MGEKSAGPASRNPVSRRQAFRQIAGEAEVMAEVILTTDSNFPYSESKVVAHPLNSRMLEELYRSLKAVLSGLPRVFESGK